MRRLARVALMVVVGSLVVALGLDLLDRSVATEGAPAPPGSSALQDSAFLDSLVRASEDLGSEITVSTSARPAPERDPLRIADLLATRSADTYIDEIFGVRDSMNFRWPPRTDEPLRIWIQRSERPDYESSFRSVVREAFSPWGETGIPVHFAFEPDSSAAEVHITWIDRYESRTSARTRWVHDQHGWIAGGGIEIALHQPDGRALDEMGVRAIALHEIGHLLGLDHCADERNIMSAQVRVSELSEADRNTVRLVYALSPGSVKSVPRAP